MGIVDTPPPWQRYAPWLLPPCAAGVLRAGIAQTAATCSCLSIRDMLTACCAPVFPENPNPLKFLTFTSAMITLERWTVPLPVTSRDKVSIMSPIVSVLLASVFTWFRSRLSMQMELIALRHQVAVYKQNIPRSTPADRSLALGLALPAVAPLATGSGVRTTPYGHHLAEEAVPGLLAPIKSARQAGTTRHRERGACAHPSYVAIQSHVGRPSHCR
jgi:hypothetical protein